MGKNKAKTAISVAASGETGSRNMAATQKNQLFDPGFPFTPDSF